MSTKNIVIWVIIILVVIIGGYCVYTSVVKQAPKADTTAGQQQNTTATNAQVQAQEVAVGTGAAAQPGDSVSVLYVGQLQDGTVFDSSAAHGNQPLVFTLGAQGLIQGFHIGGSGMKEGGE